jgi:hypothetical protein
MTHRHVTPPHTHHLAPHNAASVVRPAPRVTPPTDDSDSYFGRYTVQALLDEGATICGTKHCHAA